jgi:hypothetical protein
LAFTPLERDLLDWFATGHPDQAVRWQAASASPAGREVTPSGFFTNLRSDGEAIRFPDRTVGGWLDGPFVSSPGLPCGAITLLHVVEGHLHLLEVVSLAEGHPSEVTTWRLMPPSGVADA